MAERSTSQRICVAKIGAAHGVRGDVKLWSFTADPMAVRDYGPLETKDGIRSFAIETLRPAKNFLVVRFKGVADRNEAEKLCNIELYVSRDRLPAPEADEFYYADLVGLSAVARSGAVLGTIVAVHNFGAGDIIEVRPERGATLMLPFTEAVVPEIDIAGGRVVVEPPQSEPQG